MEIDLGSLCDSAGARLVIADVIGMDAARQVLLFGDRPPLRFDVLSIGIGSVPTVGDVRIADDSRLVAIKPMQTFLARFDEAVRAAVSERRDRPIRVAIAGGGAGGVELTLCLPAHLRTLLGPQGRSDLMMVTAAGRLMPGSLAATARRAERIFSRRGVRLITGRQVVEINRGVLTLDDGTAAHSDVILWATGASAPPVIGKLGLPTDADGFLLTSDTLLTTGCAPVFAVGDAGSIAGSSVPKAGVFAVKQGPVLLDNILRALSGAPLRRFRPQRGFLKLLNTGDGRAIGEWRRLSFEGAWCWWLKDYIDSRFIDQ